MQRLERNLVHSSEWKRLAPKGDDIVCSAWGHAAVHRRTGTEVTLCVEHKVFGGSSGTPPEQEYYKAFREKYPGITDAQQSWIDEALVHQKVTTITGLQYHYPGTKVTRSGYVTNTTQICNYPVQGFATADIIPIALTYLWHAMKEADLRSFIVNTIHDSAVSEVHPDEVEQVREISVNCFTKDVYNYLEKVYNIHFNVPLGTGFKAGKYWTEGEEIVESVAPPYKLGGM